MRKRARKARPELNSRERKRTMAIFPCCREVGKEDAHWNCIATHSKAAAAELTWRVSCQYQSWWRKSYISLHIHWTSFAPTYVPTFFMFISNASELFSLVAVKEVEDEWNGLEAEMGRKRTKRGSSCLLLLFSSLSQILLYPMQERPNGSERFLKGTRICYHTLMVPF